VKRRQAIFWIIFGVVAGATAIGLAVRIHRWSEGTARIRGAVILRDDDSQRELPISDVAVTASDGVTSATTQSNASGYFNLPFRGGVWPGQSVVLSFRHPDYEPLDIKLQSTFKLSAKELYVAAMVPLPRKLILAARSGPFKSSIKETFVATAGLPVPLMEIGRLPLAPNRWTPGLATNSAMSELPALQGLAPLRGLIRVASSMVVAR
jgi:hypothetical protein